MTGDVSNWRERSLDERQATRRAALLEAALEIVGTRGASALTTRSVAQETGLVARYIYESFESRDDLLRALFDEVLHREVTLLLSAFTEPVPEDVFQGLAAAFTAVVDHWHQDPRIVRVLFVEPQADPALVGRTRTLLHVCESALMTSLLEPVWGKESKAIEKEFTAKAITAAAIGLFTAWNEGRLDLTSAEIVTRFVDMVRRMVERPDEC